ncbi:MAG: hypothetical protein UX01_C0001G0153 [Candidatus Collierbacteria bacterium GW2011_GWB2_45_17]|uniref:Uncharacterized protein n=1 Tax=Candidatus Collierbacteria bacterium GW2011_GWB2_45_17 TaxID=1618388 RepID=A0A837IG06_9BACT|nr:MAG: hypothetical protein UW96_C0001G0147 [Candidatus Collierbacteria bacterium GW2011_GWA1_45_15]KKU01309.1 MAG: hypothetical protein UX01_C0001G0153 [Candidatus Collierbacteria bacterium GW2011_GWB2_45_17]HCX25768.1 hypothetical protein [Candidatus Collierbacteria bacterium]
MIIEIAELASDFGVSDMIEALVQISAYIPKVGKQVAFVVDKYFSEPVTEVGFLDEVKLDDGETS